MVRVEPGQVVETTLPLEAWGSLRGVVVTQDGTPMPNVLVAVSGLRRHRQSTDAQLAELAGIGGDRTDARGRFRLDGIGAGPLHVDSVTSSLRAIIRQATV